MLKIFQARLSQYVNWELPDVQAGFRKGRGTMDQIANICWSIEKAMETPSSYVALTMQKPLTVWITTNHGKFLKRWKYQTLAPVTWTVLPVSWETYMQVTKEQFELDMEQWTGSKSGKHYIEAIYCHPAFLTSMQSKSCEMPCWMNHSLESRLPGGV